MISEMIPGPPQEEPGSHINEMVALIDSVSLSSFPLFIHIIFEESDVSHWCGCEGFAEGPRSDRLAYGEKRHRIEERRATPARDM